MKYRVDLNQSTGNAAVINTETRQVAATFRRIEHGDETLYRAQAACEEMNDETADLMGAHMGRNI